MASTPSVENLALSTNAVDLNKSSSQLVSSGTQVETVTETKLDEKSQQENVANIKASSPSEPQMLNPTIDSREAFEAFCREYAPYLHYNQLVDKEVAATAELVAGLTSRTDENGLLMDPLSTKTEDRAAQIIPILKERANQLRTTFLTIDKFQEVLKKIRANLNDAQKRVEEAEEASSTISMTKFLSVFSRKEKNAAERSIGPLLVIDTKKEFYQLRTEIKATSTSK